MITEKGTSSEEITWMLDGIRMEATVTYPSGPGPFPGIVLIAGSGPTDRNWCSPLLQGENGSGKLVAEFLAERGYASIRYDKRASGKNMKENAKKMLGTISFKSHLDELVHAIENFLSSGRVDSDQLFALTNSEGALHALNYSHKNLLPKFRGFVMTGVPGRKISDVARMQVKAQVEDLPDSGKIMDRYDALISEFIAGNKVELDPTLPPVIQMLIGGLVTPANLPFSRELWSFDVKEMLLSVEAPMLLIIGQKDLQVNSKVDGKILEEIAGNLNKVTVYFPEKADHVLKHEEAELEELKPSTVAMKYNEAGRVLDAETMETITDWLDIQKE